MEELISVLMGVYNAEHQVKDAVLTIENQTIQNIELVICDDDSTDRTYYVLEELARKYDNIVLLRNPANMGLAYCLNWCLEVSHGEFVARMDADDYCLPGRLEKQLKFLKRHPEYDLVGSEMIMIDEHGRKTFSRHKRKPTADVLPLRNPFAHPTVLMHRYVLTTLGGYIAEKRTRRCEDLELWYRFFAHGYKGYNLPDYLYVLAQGIEDYRRRKLWNGWNMFLINVRGLRLLHAPAYKYIQAFKPVVSASIPKPVMKAYHDIIFRKQLHNGDERNVK